LSEDREARELALKIIKEFKFKPPSDFKAVEKVKK
jgi:hypothetical protein